MGCEEGKQRGEMAGLLGAAMEIGMSAKKRNLLRRGCQPRSSEKKKQLGVAEMGGYEVEWNSMPSQLQEYMTWTAERA